ncbi:putative Ig domain-containing protein [Sandarakinorhabdus sp.]|uniref:putative Ig domain-containing protein n=1 Tax=Sandarakinorhabdus sp. TaxID=1916663 RepID=UPI003F714566
MTKKLGQAGHEQGAKFAAGQPPSTKFDDARSVVQADVVGKVRLNQHAVAINKAPSALHKPAKASFWNVVDQDERSDETVDDAAETEAGVIEVSATGDAGSGGLGDAGSDGLGGEVESAEAQEVGDATPPVSVGSGGGIGALPLILGGLAAVGSGVAAFAGGSKKNSPPTVTANQAVTTAEDQAVTVTVVASDPDGDQLTYAASAPTKGAIVSNGNSFVYTPGRDFNGSDSFTVTISDGRGGTATQIINITVTPVNDAPVVANPIADQSVPEDTAWSYVVPSNTFTDVDNATLTLSATSGDGTALPAWLSFDAATGAFSGTPPQDFNGTFDLRVTASDGELSVADTFTLTVTPVNDAPVVANPIVVQSVMEDTAWSYVVPVTTFSDVDNAAETLTLSATSGDGTALPAWLSFNPATRTFSGTPPQDFNGALDLRVTASDGELSVSDTFTLNVVSDPEETLSIDVTNDAEPTIYDANGSGFTLGDNFRFTDNSSLPTNARIVNFAVGDTIEVTGSSSDYSFSALGDDLTIVYNNTVAGVLNQITLVGVLAGVNAFISDEESAEAALGFDFFRALTSPTGNGSGLDADDDGNLLTSRLFDAAGADFSFQEDANVANTASIVNFAAGDRITVSNAVPGAYSFSGAASDITITANQNGVVSSITLVGVNPGNLFVNDQASAEAAVGFDFFQFAGLPQPPSLNVVIGIDNGSVLASFSAATDSINFTDDASKETNVVIDGFSNDDRITVSGASVLDYSFGTGVDPNDLEIVFNNTNAGVQNVIVLNDVLVGKNDFIFDYDSAASALGFEFMTFA